MENVNTTIENDEVLDLTPLGSALLQMEKGSNEELEDTFYTLDFFAKVENDATGEVMICFSVEEIEGKYFWASTSLFDLLNRNYDKATEDSDARARYFRQNDVKIKYNGKTQLKSDPSKSCNVWKMQVTKK